MTMHDELDELEAMEREISPAPWSVEATGSGPPMGEEEMRAWERGRDLVFAARLRNAFPALLARLRRAETQVAELADIAEEAMTYVHDYFLEKWDLPARLDAARKP